MGCSMRSYHETSQTAPLRSSDALILWLVVMSPSVTQHLTACRATFGNGEAAAKE